MSFGATNPQGVFPPLSRIGRALFAFLVGILLYTALVAAFNEAFGLERAHRPGNEKPLQTMFVLAAAMLMTGYGTAWIAGPWEIWVSLALGALLAFGPESVELVWQGMDRSFGRQLALLIMLPAAALGGALRREVARTQRARRPPLTLPLTIRMPAAVVWLGFLLSLLMAAAAVWAAALAGEPKLGWTGGIFFGATSLLIGWAGLLNRPQAVFREDGIEMPALKAVIPWSEIEDAFQSPRHPIEYVQLRLRDPGKYLARMNPLQLAVSQTGEPEPNIGIALIATPYRAEEICELVRSQLRR